MPPTRKALVVGIDNYFNARRLYGCVEDARAVTRVLERNGDGSPNFDVVLLTGTEDESVLRTDLRARIVDLFDDDIETVLFYFAGHGHVESTGGYLQATDSLVGDDGIPLSEILTLANKSSVRNRIVILDSCHSGAAGTRTIPPYNSELAEGMTILTASTAKQYAAEDNRGGVFTTLFVDALNGAAANLVGDITPGSVYAHVDQSLGSWSLQRPVFKTNVKYFVSLRKVQAPIDPRDLRKITEFFPTPGYKFRLDPSFEPTSDRPRKKNNRIFTILQKMNRVNLVVPVDAPHMYYAAMDSKSCKLTMLGEHYRRLVAEGRI